MPFSLSHYQCQLEMCCCCGCREGKNKVTKAFGAEVKKYAQSGWNPEVFSFPIGICDACRSRSKHLKKHSRQEGNVQLSSHYLKRNT